MSRKPQKYSTWDLLEGTFRVLWQIFMISGWGCFTVLEIVARSMKDFCAQQLKK